MRCAWQAYINLLPHWMREKVDTLGKTSLQELRLRVDRPPELITGEDRYYLDRTVSSEDISYCVNSASQYSPWSSSSISNGYITASGGHRIGICGDMAVINGKNSTITNLTSLCIRVARDYPGIGKEAAAMNGSLLIIGSPGSGKTTLMRDIIRQKSNGDKTVGVVDERRELFPAADRSFSFSVGMHTDVLSGCSKQKGIEMLMRTMSPDWIAVDEITAEEDTEALIRACWCGVSMLATAHAANLQDLLSRPVYQPLVQSGVFETILVMKPDKSWTAERIPS